MSIKRSSLSVAVVGGGIIGLATALALARRNVSVTLFEKNELGRGASWAAAGMLAPAFEAAGAVNVHPRLFDLCLASAELWPEWAKKIEADSGASAGYDHTATIAISVSSDGSVQIDRLANALKNRGVAFERFDANGLRRIEGTLSSRVREGLRLPTDTQVDNRATLAALIKLCLASPLIEVVNDEPNLSISDGALDHEGFDATLVCAGWRTPMVKSILNGSKSRLDLADPILDQLQPVGGQMLAVERCEASPTHTIRSDDLYIVPKVDRIIIGATVEPGRVLKEPESAIIKDLQERAAEICPILGDAPGLEAWAGVRPGTPSHAPIMGATAVSGLFVASGHYRNGVLLAPITANIMANIIVDGQSSELADAFAIHNAVPEAV